MWLLVAIAAEEGWNSILLPGVMSKLISGSGDWSNLLKLLYDDHKTSSVVLLRTPESPVACLRMPSGFLNAFNDTPKQHSLVVCKAIAKVTWLKSELDIRDGSF